MRKTMLFLAMFGLLAACATIEGVGRDISGGAKRVNSWLN